MVTALTEVIVIQTFSWSMRRICALMGSAVNRMALAWHCICGGGGLFSGSLDMLVVPSHMLPPSTNCTGRAKAGRAQDVLLESFSCPFMCPFGPRASQASGRAERRRSEDERVFRVKPFAEMQGRMTLSLNYSGFSKHRMKCWMWQCSPCQHSVWEAARQREVKRVCSAAGTAAGPCQLTSDLLRAYQ